MGNMTTIERLIKSGTITEKEVAQHVGRKAKGVPKRYSPEERQKKSERMKAINERRRRQMKGNGK